MPYTNFFAIYKLHSFIHSFGFMLHQSFLSCFKLTRYSYVFCWLGSTVAFASAARLVGKGSAAAMKYILVTGGVISGIGKGVIASSIGTILKSSGLRVTSIKIDPYINIDAGTFSPYEHGEWHKVVVVPGPV